VPDPYYGGDEGFEHVLDVIEAACGGLLRRIVTERNMLPSDGDA
jgi:protein-tyrosine phosphatase